MRSDGFACEIGRGPEGAAYQESEDVDGCSGLCLLDPECAFFDVSTSSSICRLYRNDAADDEAPRFGDVGDYYDFTVCFEDFSTAKAYTRPYGSCQGSGRSTML